MSSTTIEWCDEVWNPVRGCARISPGCVAEWPPELRVREWPRGVYTGTPKERLR
jgi:protein gp37